MDRLFNFVVKLIGFYLFLALVISIQSHPVPDAPMAGLNEYLAAKDTVNTPVKMTRRFRAERIWSDYDYCVVQANGDLEASSRCYLRAKAQYIPMAGNTLVIPSPLGEADEALSRAKRTK